MAVVNIFKRDLRGRYTKFLHPNVPRHTMPTSQWDLRPFSFDNVSRIAPIKCNPRLGTIEPIILFLQSLSESTDGVCRLEYIPWLEAGHTLAGLEYHEKGVQSVDSLCQVATENLRPIE